MTTTRFTTPPSWGDPHQQAGRQADGPVGAFGNYDYELDISQLDTILLALPEITQRQEWLLTWATGHDEQARVAAREAQAINARIEQGERALSQQYDAWSYANTYGAAYSSAYGEFGMHAAQGIAQGAAAVRAHALRIEEIERSLGALRQEWMRLRNLAAQHAEAARRLRAEAALAQ